MVTRRPSSSQFKKTSRQMRNATISNQLSGAPSPVSARGGFSNARRARTAQRGEIHQVLPSTSTRESRRHYENRMSQRDFIERGVNVGRRRKIAIAAILAAAVLVVACVVAAFVYTGSIDSRMAASDKDALKGVLAAPVDSGAQCTLVSVGYEGKPVEFVALMRADATNGQATVITIPGDVCQGSGEGAKTLSEAYASGGNAGLVSAVRELSGVQPSHYVRIDAEGFARLVDVLGGVEVMLDAEVSDAELSGFSLPAGAQTLSGEQALLLCRANDFEDAERSRSENIARVAASLVSKLASTGGIDFYLRMDGISGCVETDLDVKGAQALLSSLRFVGASSVAAGAMPTQQSSDGALLVSTKEWEAMLGRVNAGLSPYEEVEDIVAAIDPASFSITVNNGGGIVGAAGEAKSMLEDAGFTVSSVGNAAMQVYDETLVVYKDEQFADEAEAVVAVLGRGRTVWDVAYYLFDTDVLVVVGKDWNPEAAAQAQADDDGASGDGSDAGVSGEGETAEAA